MDQKIFKEITSNPLKIIETKTKTGYSLGGLTILFSKTNLNNLKKIRNILISENKLKNLVFKKNKKLK